MLLPRPALLLLALLAMSGCGSATSPSDAAGTPASGAGGRLKVVATTTQVADFAHQIGGDAVEVFGMLRPNVDPHDFDPSPADLQAISDAQVIVKNGVGLESWFDKTIDAAQPTGAIVDSSEGVTRRQSRGEGGTSGALADDPHIWHDPMNAKVMVANIERAFERADPARAGTYRANLDAYSRRLDELDHDIRAEIDTLANKKLVTNHDAFHYFVDRYGLEFVGSIIPSFDTSAELSVAEREELVAKIKALHVKAIFTETSLPPKTADAIAHEAGVKIVEGERSLYGDTLGPDGSDGSTYLEMERHNAEVIVDNLR